jgi:hypothetical protein
MATKWQRVKIKLPTPITDLDKREELADLIIERIVERTDQGKDKDGNAFAKYSKAYKDSLDFKNAGKGSTPNLQLSGDMLAAIKVLESTKNYITVGFEKGSTENGKADGNIRGTYGNPSPVGPKRDFLGISEKDLVKFVKFINGGSSGAAANVKSSK